MLKLAVNGKEVSGASKCVPRIGYICLESEGSECHFRNLRIKELPSTGPSGAEKATLDEGLISLYSGLDLRGWRLDPGHAGHWRAKDSVLEYDGKSTAKEKDLWTEKAFGDFVLSVDWRLPGKPAPRKRAVVLPNGDDAKNDDGSAKTIEIPYAGDSGILLRGSGNAQVNITCNTIGSGELYDYRVDKTMPAEVRSGAIPKVKADSPAGQVEPVRDHPEEGPGDSGSERANGDRPRAIPRNPGRAGRSGSSITATRFSSRTCSSRRSSKRGSIRLAIVAAAAGRPVQSASNTAETTTEKSGSDTDEAVSPRR